MIFFIKSERRRNSLTARLNGCCVFTTSAYDSRCNYHAHVTTSIISYLLHNILIQLSMTFLYSPQQTTKQYVYKYTIQNRIKNKKYYLFYSQCFKLICTSSWHFFMK